MGFSLRAGIAGVIVSSLAIGLAGPAIAAPQGTSTVGELVGSALLRFPAFATLADSRVLAAPAMLTGRLTDPAGSPLRGAQVLLAAWPSNESLRELPVGGEFDITPVARTVAGADGSYALRSLLTPLLASLTGENGIDVELNIFHNDRHYVYLSQVRPNLLTGQWLGDVLTPALVPAVQDEVDGVLDLALDPATGEDLRITTADEPIPAITRDDLPMMGMSCTKYQKVTSRRAMTRVAAGIARNGPTIKTVYTEGAETTTSTGISFGEGVEFSISGARTRSSSFTAGYFNRTAARGETVAREYRAQVEHDVLRRVCHGNHFQRYKVQYMTQPSRITGGFDDVEARFAPVTCNRKHTVPALGRYATAETQRATTYSNAFSIAPFKGVSFLGAAQSGYSKTVNMQFRFTGKRAGWLCGDSDVPTAKDQRLQAFEE